MKRIAGIFLLITIGIFGFAQQPGIKASAELLHLIEKRNRPDSIHISIALRSALPNRITMLRHTRIIFPEILSGTIAATDLPALYNDSNILFINEYLKPREELNAGAVDYTINAIRYAQHKHQWLRGDSLLAVIKERRFDTSDIDLTRRTFLTGMEDPTTTTHAALMTTIIAGGGNTSPSARGVASGAYAGSVSFSNLFPEPDAFYTQHRAVVQNHSYGTLVENFYGNEAMAFDRMAQRFPNTLFVFSAGNAGSQAGAVGPYSNIAGAANLTGNFKQAKNIITVGATDSLNNVMTQSSKGPSYDGRIKPELVAFGEDGSSGAAALVSGAALLVADAYKKQTFMPAPSVLLKAVLLNSADDAGPRGIDYQSGFGSLNAFRALETIQQQRYFTSSIRNAEVQTFSIPVPANQSLLKITITWNDSAALPGASKTLVNNIDAVLHHPATSGTWQPWVLSAAASPDSLTAPARRGTDSLNNVEQITVTQPASGNYQLRLTGNRIRSASQSFAIAYQIDSAQTAYFTFPTSNDPLKANSKHIIRWFSNDTGSVQLSYSTNGSTWSAIRNLPNASTGQTAWQVPDTIAIALLRLHFPASGRNIVSDSFVISPSLRMQTGFDCVDSFLLFWNRIPSAHYQLCRLNQQYLSAFLPTPDTAVVLRQQPTVYFAVAPLINGRQGLRSSTIHYQNAGAACYFLSFFLQSQNRKSAQFKAELGTLFNIAKIEFQKLRNGAFASLQTQTNITGTQFSFSDTLLSSGENRYRLKITLNTGAIVYSQAEVVYHVSETMPLVAYPNPVKRGTTMNLIVSEAGRFQMKIMDAKGRITAQQLLTRSVTSFPTHAWQSGLYVVRIFDTNGVSITQKIIVQ